MNSPYTEEWKQQRHISQTILRKLSEGKGRLETGISEEMNHLKRVLSEHKEVPFNPKEHMTDAITNILCRVIFDERYDYKSGNFRDLRRKLEEGFKSPFPDGAIGHVPFLNVMWPPWRRSHNEHKEAQRWLINFLLGRVEAHPEDNNDSCNTDSFMECYRDKVKTGKVENRLLHILHDFLVAGVENTATTIIWCVYYLARYPELQQKAYEAVVKVVGSGRKPGLVDRDKMPYVEAVVMETLRLSCPSPLAIPHVARQNTEVKGFKIPRGTWVGTRIPAKPSSFKICCSYHRHPSCFNCVIL